MSPCAGLTSINANVTATKDCWRTRVSEGSGQRPAWAGPRGAHAESRQLAVSWRAFPDALLRHASRPPRHRRRTQWYRPRPYRVSLGHGSFQNNADSGTNARAPVHHAQVTATSAAANNNAHGLRCSCRRWSGAGNRTASKMAASAPMLDPGAVQPTDQGLRTGLKGCRQTGW